ncbi:hypothetical protein XNC3_1640063 [Xenorhabdus nematophila F1]|nr:hypothetical protein XNC3_1640063 [Xenorhabdus nematophila F1]
MVFSVADPFLTCNYRVENDDGGVNKLSSVCSYDTPYQPKDSTINLTT